MVNQNTITTYNNAIERLQTAGYKFNMTFDDIIIILNKIKSKNKKPILNKSKLIYLKALLFLNKEKKFLNKETFQKIQEFMKKTNNIALNKCKKGVLTKNQIDNYVEWDEIEKIYNTIEKNESSKNIAIIGCFVLQPPRRILDYSDMYYVKNTNDLSKKYNYYVDTKEPYFIFNKYKTFKNYKQQKIIVNQKLTNIFSNYINDYNIEPDSSLFKLTNTNFKQIVRNIMFKWSDKYISANIFRHSYITMMQKTNQLQTTEDREKLAYQMANGIICQLNYFVNTK